MSPINMQRLESGLRLGMSYIEAVNGHKIDALLAFLTSDCVLEPSIARDARREVIGRENIGSYYGNLFSQRNNLHFLIEEIFGISHRCIIRWKCTWSDVQNQEQRLFGADIIREKDNLICEIMSYCRAE